MSQIEQLDLIVFGATGFVGTLVCRYLAAHLIEKSDVRWGIAGRSLHKLDSLVQSLGGSIANLPTFIVDIADEECLTDLCRHTKVIISTVGPYALYGETLIKVCATLGTDYCDLTGEVQWVRQMIQKYEAIARKSGSRIVHSCGFDSIPSDLGVYYLQQQAQHNCNETCTRVKMRVIEIKGGVSGGTAASGINLVKEAISDPKIKEILKSPYSLCPARDIYPEHLPILAEVQLDETFQEWIAPFIMAGINTPVVLRSNALQDWPYGNNFQYDEAMLMGAGNTGWLTAQAFKIGLESMTIAMAIPPIRWLLKQIIPKPGEGPSVEEQTQGFYNLRFWGETVSGQTLMVKVTGDLDPGYGSTAKILAQAGLCLAKDIPKSAKAGGFWTPSTIFGSALIERLTNYAGLTFELVEIE